MADIQDFGEKIGGARKDVWKARGLIYDDIAEMNAMERKTHIKKDNIWIRPDWEKIIADGTPQGIAYWQNNMRKAIPPRPARQDEDALRHYVEVVGQIRDAVMAVREPHEIDTFYKNFLRPAYVKDTGNRYVEIIPEATGVINNKVLRASQSDYRTMARDADANLFGIPADEKIYVSTKKRLSIHKYDDENVRLERDERHDGDTILTVKGGFGTTYYYLSQDGEFSDIDAWQKDSYFVLDKIHRKPIKIGFPSVDEAQEFIESYARAVQEDSNKRVSEKSSEPRRKGPFVPPHLRHVKRTGPDYRMQRHADGDWFLTDLKFRGGEFGNWLNHEDRQASLDMAYDALRDLARLLQFRPEDISLGGSLAIAFGARGRGGANAAAAHYEPDRQVINLTKMSGAGCLAHEWCHALDHAIGIAYGSSGLASEMPSKRALPKPLTDLLSAMKYKEIPVEANQVEQEQAERTAHCQKNMKYWLDSAKPRNLSASLVKRWDNVAEKIMANPAAFSSTDYVQILRNDAIKTRPEIEILSQLSKLATGHHISRSTKHQICLWASELARSKEKARSTKPVYRTEKTEFYKDSITFDQYHSRASHGYYQSDCEMFARAFDCYIADKLKESGLCSDYLSAHANSFILSSKPNGKTVAAIPMGDERTALNKKFDLLFEDLKERGILHDFSEDLGQYEPGPDRPGRTLDMGPFPTHFEQMSLDDVLFSAQSRTQQGNASQGGYPRDPSR